MGGRGNSGWCFHTWQRCPVYAPLTKPLRKWGFSPNDVYDLGIEDMDLCTESVGRESSCSGRGGGGNLHVEVSSHGDEIEIELLPPALQLHRTHTTQPITEHGARCHQGRENRFRRKKFFTWKLLVGTAGSPALFLYIYVFTIGFENIS